MDQRNIRVAVVGVGHLGTLHVQKLLTLPGVVVVGAVDPNDAQRARATQLFGIPAFASLPELLQYAEHVAHPAEHGDHVTGAARSTQWLDAVIIAAPTVCHAALVTHALEHDLHVLVEKPIATTTAQGQLLCDLAAKRQKWLQVGHTERFNPAVRAAMQLLTGSRGHDTPVSYTHDRTHTDTPMQDRERERPRYIVAERLGPFPGGRGSDVDVVLDRMIHDLDIVAALVPAPLVEVRAIGVPILTDEADMASARLQFADGTVAQLSAGRASLESSRKLRLFTTERYISIDCIARTVHAVRRLPPTNDQPWPQIMGEPVHVPDEDALAQQDAHFIQCIRTGTPPWVDGHAGLRALALAEAVIAAMRESEIKRDRSI